MSPDNIAAKLADVKSHPYIVSAQIEENADAIIDSPDDLDRLFMQLRIATGVDSG